MWYWLEFITIHFNRVVHMGISQILLCYKFLTKLNKLLCILNILDSWFPILSHKYMHIRNDNFIHQMLSRISNLEFQIFTNISTNQNESCLLSNFLFVFVKTIWWLKKFVQVLSLLLEIRETMWWWGSISKNLKLKISYMDDIVFC